MPDFIPPQQRPAWQALARLARQGQPHLRELLHDPQRSQAMVCSGAGLTLDHSRQRVTPEVMAQLLALARASDVRGQLAAMLRGEPINTTETAPCCTWPCVAVTHPTRPGVRRFRDRFATSWIGCADSPNKSALGS